MNDTAPQYFGSAIVLIISTLAYHVSQKSIPSNVHPVISAACTFFIALMISLVILPMFVGIRDIVGIINHLNWANFVSGLSIVGITAGHVLYYRMGWSLSTGTLFSYGTVCVFLIPVGLLFFHEKINLYNAAGIAVSLVGLYLLTKK